MRARYEAWAQGNDEAEVIAAQPPALTAPKRLHDTGMWNWLLMRLSRIHPALRPSGCPSRERRRCPRSNFRAGLTVLAADKIQHKGICRDISENGLGAIVYGDLSLCERGGAEVPHCEGDGQEYRGYRPKPPGVPLWL